MINLPKSSISSAIPSKLPSPNILTLTPRIMLSLTRLSISMGFLRKFKYSLSKFVIKDLKTLNSGTSEPSSSFIEVAPFGTLLLTFNPIPSTILSPFPSTKTPAIFL
ncbi:106aa long hypothetical protein [Pyrococcus horikoshii OT3]|uniref:Uncharacterized protein n=1 Tax=Pyrococcus horikoshii (strain ATCC 700860 / DSM 12428 / JCM 9974 / NBRC 100139 / OT-3) TaxID=70601 RepID=O57884_PYRHO|nr:106aa long hypothetical protein [Pyrococcus horikoshii OT3]